MPRETRTIETPAKNKVELNTYLTGGEAREIQRIFLRDAETDIAGKTSVGKVKAENFLEVEQKMIELLVVSFNESKDNLIKTISDLPLPEYQHIVNEVVKASSDFLGGKK